MRRALAVALLLITSSASAQTISGGLLHGSAIGGTSAPAPPTIDSFSSNAANPCTEPCSHTLTWATTGATSCNGTQTVASDFTSSQAVDGSDAVSASLTTVYTLTCTGPGGSDATPTVTVNTIPAMPTSFDAASGDTLFTNTWTNPSPATVDHNELRWRCPNGSGGYTTVNPATSGVQVTGRTNDTQCDSEVRAVDSASAASAYATDLVTPHDGTAPGVPGSFNCTPGDTQFTCTWSASSGDPDHYEFGYRCPSGSGSYTDDTAATSPETRTSLTNDVECDARVRALDEVPNASSYATDTVTPTAGGSLSATFTGPCNFIKNNDSDETNECYSTRVKGLSDAGTGDTLYDASRYIVEDFDAPTLWDTVNHATWVGGGSPMYGPPYDATGIANYRGFNGYLQNVWGNPTNFCLWPILEPASPTIGPACNAGGSGCSHMVTVDDADPYQAKGHTNGHCINIVTDGGTSFVDGADPWTGAASSNGTVWGNAALEGIQHVGAEGPHLGQKSLGGNRTDIGVTMAVLFSANHPTASGSANGSVTQVKGDEWFGNGSGEYLWGWQSNQDNPYTESPFSGFVWVGSCPAGTVTAGDMNCSSPVRSFARVGWTRPSDFFGTWHCLRYRIEGLGTSTTRFRMWDELTADGSPFIDVTWDGTTAQNDYYNTYWAQWNYNNPDQYDGGGEPGVTRSYDNIHIRGGHPVSCEQIGFPAP